MIINLCFHGVGVCSREREPGEARYWIAVDPFRRILDDVAERPNVRLSFDDGNRSDIDIALPELKERGLTATFFALAGRLDDGDSVDASALRSLRAADMGVGSHGWSHVPWRGLSANDIRREFYDAREALAEASAGPITEAAFPLGRYDRSTLRALRTAGYRAVFSSDRFPARASSWLQARYSVTAGDDAASVRTLIERRVGAREARNVAASIVKRLR
ncbi:polysaccharide deacetylase family protein [Microbacterium sp. RD1]|uniref:polysaccharide deacetylase family protein n=1 Tax=Microbacterium sp. RD1 TaxID=3457313 RepID=UPI003FA5A808